MTATAKRQGSRIVTHAADELQAAGYLTGNEYDRALAHDVLALLQKFADQGHSGFSAGVAVHLFSRLALYGILCPLTGKPQEWGLVSRDDEPPLWQNKRCSTVFRGADGRPYDIDGIIFEEPSGNWFTNKHSIVYIEFPYMPAPKRVKVPAGASTNPNWKPE